MCFTVHPYHPKAKVAKRDIVCYKAGYKYRGGRVFMPYFQMDYSYQLGKTQPKVKLMPVRLSNEDLAIQAGYHSYSNKKELRGWKSDPIVVSVKCIIPKGTEYYYNPEDREYVSETLVVKEFIKI